MSQEPRIELSSDHYSPVRDLLTLFNTNRRTASAVVGEVRALGYHQVKRLADVYQVVVEYESRQRGVAFRERTELSSEDVSFLRDALPRKLKNGAAKILGSLRARGLDVKSMAHVHELLANFEGTRR